MLAVRRESRLGRAGAAEFHFGQVCVRRLWDMAGEVSGGQWDSRLRLEMCMHVGEVLLLLLEVVHSGERGARQSHGPGGALRGAGWGGGASQ